MLVDNGVFSLISNDKLINLVDALIHCQSFKFGNYTLSSGKTSSYYLDLRLIQSYPDQYKIIIDSYIDLIKNIGIDSFDYVCGVETAGLIYSVPISILLDKPHVYIRKSKKGYGRERNLEGNLEHNSRVLLVDDVFTTGTSLVDGFNLIHDSGSKVSSSIVIIDRLEPSHSIFDSLGMKLSNVTNIINIANILHSKSIIDNDQKNLVLANIID